MMLFRTFVGPSVIQGMGIFAAEAIAEGALLWQIDPRFDLLISDAESGRLPSHVQEFLGVYAYPYRHRDGYSVFNTDNSRFMNHSFTPNTDFTSFDQGFAIAPIREGEEITCNYSEFDPRFSGAFGTQPQPVHPQGDRSLA